MLLDCMKYFASFVNQEPEDHLVTYVDTIKHLGKRAFVTQCLAVGSKTTTSACRIGTANLYSGKTK